MFKRSVLVSFIVLFAAALWAGNEAGTTAPGEAGYVLLDKIITGFKVMAQKGTG